ncbi:MAG: sulfur carrier protein ThiS adenylyltransferase ThiF [Spirochaetes bacterium]|nr:sulfur carrier protein ThiS adenylyltransferase ThiF [Spirochaetota bacterium]MBU0953840.1 sulfur carrier protein ThiS adenylyltransferase ThiF [Spirochaetota bacterium]
MNTRDWYRSVLSTKTVGIAGCGGLGSNCAAALARAAIGRLIIADFDTVSEANLDRQYFFRDQLGLPKTQALAATIHRIDPAVSVVPHTVRVDTKNLLDLFADCDVLIEAFDEAAQKAMLIETILQYRPDLPLISSSGLAGWGKSDSMRVYRSQNLIMIGDLSSEVSETLPPTAGRVAIAANIQANEVIALLLGDKP